MAKTQKPAPKGGKKIAAPKKLTDRQIDQLNADKMRAAAFASTQPVRQTVEEHFDSDAALPAPPPSPKSKWWRQYQDTETGEFIGWRKVLTKTKNQVISRLRLRKPAR